MLVFFRRRSPFQASQKEIRETLLFNTEALVKPLLQTRKVHGYRERFPFLV